jgi:phosphate-selective porin OprO and OprP
MKIKKTDMKRYQLVLATIAGLQFIVPALAADDTATNSTGAAQVAPVGSSEEAEIEALKKEVQELSQKVQSLEQQREPEQPAARDTNQDQIQALDQKVRILERQRELDKDNAATVTRTQPRLTVGASGVTFSSADTNFAVSLHGVLQADSRTFFEDNGLKGNDGFILRRARPILSGTVFRDFDYLFVPDFGGNTVQIFDALVNYRYRPELQLQAGKFKSPIGLEALVADRDILFNERSLATDLVPNRDLGAELHGDLFGGVASYAAGIFNGAPDYNGTTTNADYDNNKAFAGRVFLQPWKTSDVTALKGLGFGLSGSYEVDRAATNTATGLTPGYTTDGQQKFFSYSSGVFANGTHWRLSPQAYYYYGPLGLLGEYVISDQQVTKGASSADLQNTAWEISGSWLLTGEDATYNSVTPRHPFDPRNGQWGAWQVVARYANLDVDKNAFPTFASYSSSASSARAWSVGLNWYLNNNIRVDTSFSRTLFSGYTGGTPAVPAQPENVLFTRVQLAF